MNSSDPEQELFETHDIYLAAYLKISGCEMIKRRREGPRVHFVFRNLGGSMTEMREAYYSGKGQVAANLFAQEVINFKQLCFE